MSGPSKRAKIRIIPYHRGSELTPLIQSFLGPGVDARFVVPSRRDRDWWLRRAGRDRYGPCDAPTGTVWNWQELYDDICLFHGARRRRPISPPDHLLILRHILSEALEEDPELVRLWPGLARSGFLDILSDDVRELLNEAVRPEQMETRSEGLMPRLLPKVYGRYLRYLEENGLLDSAQIWTAALEALEGAGGTRAWGAGLTVVFTGFLSFTHGQIELVRALAPRCDAVVVLKPEAGMSGFYDAGEQLSTPPSLPGPAAEGRAVGVSVAEPGLEPEFIARSLALWASGEGDLAAAMPFPGFSSVGVLCGEEGALIEGLKRYGVPFTLETGEAIARTLPGRVLASIRSLHGQNFPTHETALLLTQPCFSGIELSVVNALKAGPVGLSAWERYLRAARQDEAVETALRSIRAIAALCRVLARGGRPLELMEAFYKFLTTRGIWLDRMTLSSPTGEGLGCPELDEGLRSTASAIATVREKVVALRELLPDIGPLGQSPLAGDRAFEFLDTWCRQSNTRPPLPLSGAVHLYAGLPPVLASYPVWIMLDVTQRVWPGPIPGSPLLGESERALIGENGAHLPSPQEKAAQREALFRRLLQTGEALTVISQSELDEDDRPLAASPFVERFFGDMRGWVLDRLPTASLEILTGGDYLFPGIDPEPGGPAGRFRPVIRDGREEDRPPSSLSLGVSDLRELLSCPLLWWLRRRAKLRERSLELVTPADWGTLAHALWEGTWRRFRERKEEAGALFVRLLREEWDKLVSRDEAYKGFGSITSDRRLHRRLENLHFRVQRLGDVQGRVIDRMRQAGLRHRDIWLEEDARLRLVRDGVTFTGQCDRIEILEDGSGGLHALITDYKEGRSEKYEGAMSLEHCPWNGDGREKFKLGLQLSAYALMFERQHPEVALAGVGFLGLEDGMLAGTLRPEALELFAGDTPEPGGNAPTLQEREEEAEYAMGCAAALLRTGEFPPDYRSELCRTCGMKSICRRGEFQGEPLGPDEDEEEDDGDAY